MSSTSLNSFHGKNCVFLNYVKATWCYRHGYHNVDGFYVNSSYLGIYMGDRTLSGINVDQMWTFHIDWGFCIFHTGQGWEIPPKCYITGEGRNRLTEMIVMMGYAGFGDIYLHIISMMISLAECKQYYSKTGIYVNVSALPFKSRIREIVASISQTGMYCYI